LAYREALDETLEAMKEQFEASINTFQPRFEAEAVRALSLTCPNAPHQCPAPTVELESEIDTSFGKAYAQAWIQSATTFAEALAKDPVKLPPIPGSEADEAPAP